MNIKFVLLVLLPIIIAAQDGPTPILMEQQPDYNGWFYVNSEFIAFYNNSDNNNVEALILATNQSINLMPSEYCPSATNFLTMYFSKIGSPVCAIMQNKTSFTLNQIDVLKGGSLNSQTNISGYTMPFFQDSPNYLIFNNEESKGVNLTVYSMLLGKISCIVNFNDELGILAGLAGENYHLLALAANNGISFIYYDCQTGETTQFSCPPNSAELIFLYSLQEGNVVVMSITSQNSSTSYLAFTLNPSNPVFGSFYNVDSGTNLNFFIQINQTHFILTYRPPNQQSYLLQVCYVDENMNIVVADTINTGMLLGSNPGLEPNTYFINYGDGVMLLNVSSMQFISFINRGSTPLKFANGSTIYITTTGYVVENPNGDLSLINFEYYAIVNFNDFVNYQEAYALTLSFSNNCTLYVFNGSNNSIKTQSSTTCPTDLLDDALFDVQQTSPRYYSFAAFLSENNSVAISADDQVYLINLQKFASLSGAFVDYEGKTLEMVGVSVGLSVGKFNFEGKNIETTRLNTTALEARRIGPNMFMYADEKHASVYSLSSNSVVASTALSAPFGFLFNFALYPLGMQGEEPPQAVVYTSIANGFEIEGTCITNFEGQGSCIENSEGTNVWGISQNEFIVEYSLKYLTGIVATYEVVNYKSIQPREAFKDI